MLEKWLEAAVTEIKDFFKSESEKLREDFTALETRVKELEKKAERLVIEVPAPAPPTPTSEPSKPTPPAPAIPAVVHESEPATPPAAPAPPAPAAPPEKVFLDLRGKQESH